MKNILYFLIVFGSLFTCAAQEKGIVKNISPKKLERKAQKESLQLVDVRTPEEYQEGTINNAQNIDYLSEDFNKNIVALDKNKPVYVFCKSGVRGGKAAKVMTSLGFKKVYNIKGGYQAWESKKNK
ncbi:rhodanese-like domain-containing protein [Flavobacterium sp. '19STA2R22 D10 B1']|uniref:rhodanese-like domain-containing protein n=1 Tax=Flavobacterium aerium TaxID=3037261 RepID=UPI00278BF0C3|nr:rhodanese-like domain-containing protein [Flavobacterium sp. '19STA2R22 D10 B1']